MRARAGRYGSILLVLGVLAFPVLDIAESPQLTFDPGPFLDQAVLQVRASHVLGGFARDALLPATPAEADTPAEPASVQPVSIVVVREGQSLWDIASRHQTTVDALIEANDLRDASLIKPGQQLILPASAAPAPPAAPAAKSVAQKAPATRKISVVLYQGQTLWDVARAYGTSVEEIAALNGLSSPDVVRAGQRLLVPARRVATAMPRRLSTAISSSASAAASSALSIAQGFVWPARGRLTSGFGWRRWRHHDGIDIAAPRGTPITAARPGRVIFAGWYYAYGKAVILDHGNGLQTLYGHASALLVRPGQLVDTGQVIARVGSTGHSTGPHLHFEVRINGRAVNPLKYL